VIEKRLECSACGKLLAKQFKVSDNNSKKNVKKCKKHLGLVEIKCYHGKCREITMFEL